VGLSAPPALGVLPAQCLRAAIESGIVSSPTYSFEEGQIQPASLDLRLGEVAYRLQCSFLPGQATVESELSRYKMGEVDLRDGAVLEQNRPYLIPLAESLELPPQMRARANPKSSTGRLDIFTRVVSDHSSAFDDIAAGYKGRLYLEVVSRSFTVRVRRGLKLNQLRLMTGESRLADEDLRELHSQSPILLQDDKSVPLAKLPVNGGLFLSLELPDTQDHRSVGWRAKKNSHLLDLTVGRLREPREFWEPVYPEPGGGIVLEPEEFYLLLSRESVRVPPDLAAEMVAYDPTSGELRTHYAGFFDPGFGHGDGTRPLGSRAALEVRAHDVPFMINHGQRVCRLSFERLVETPTSLYGLGSHYQFQQQTLSKHFRLPESVPAGAASAAGRPAADAEGGLPMAPLFSLDELRD
jgi:dCTP deaminase